MRYKALYDPATGKKIAEYVDGELTWSAPDYGKSDSGFMVMPDIQPYRSMIDGSIINSRSQHRAHLRSHGMVEVGNDSSVMNVQRRPLSPPPGLKQAIIQATNSVIEKRRR